MVCAVILTGNARLAAHHAFGWVARVSSVLRNFDFAGRVVLSGCLKVSNIKIVRNKHE